jgi:hypothetical protein
VEKKISPSIDHSRKDHTPSQLPTKAYNTVTTTTLYILDEDLPSPSIGTRKNDAPGTSTSQKTSPFRVREPAVKEALPYSTVRGSTESTPENSTPQKPGSSTTSSAVEAGSEALSENGLSRNATHFFGAETSPVFEAARPNGTAEGNSPQKPSPVELAKLQAQKRLEYELACLVSAERLPSPAIGNEIDSNAAAEMELAKLPEDSIILRHESWKKLQDFDNNNAAKRAESGRAARLALRKESHAYSKSLVTNPKSHRAPSPTLIANSTSSRATPFVAMPSVMRSAFMPPNHSGTSFDTLTGNVAVRVAQEDIRRAIPANASCVVHVMDRRVNLDACAPDASNYSLLRSWVQDDPHRQIPSAGSNIFEYVTLPSNRRDTRNMKIVLPKMRKIESIEKCNVIDSLVNKGEQDSVPSLNSLRDKMISKGKQIRREKRKEEKAWMEASRESLKGMGIEIPSVTF